MCQLKKDNEQGRISLHYFRISFKSEGKEVERKRKRNKMER